MTGNPYIRDKMTMGLFMSGGDIDSRSAHELNQLRDRAKTLVGPAAREQLRDLRAHHEAIRQTRLAKLAAARGAKL